MTDTKTRPAAVTLTPSAEQRIADLMAKAPDDAIGVKLSTPRRGCSGLAYSVDYVSQANAFDERIETPGGAIAHHSASGIGSSWTISMPMRVRQPQLSGRHTKLPRFAFLV